MSAPIEMLHTFRYLGVDLHSTAQITVSSADRAAPAQHAALALHNRCRFRGESREDHTSKRMSVENTETTGEYRMRPAKGTSPGEAKLTNGPTKCGGMAAGAAEPSPRGSNAPLEELAIGMAFSKEVIRRRTKRGAVQDGGTVRRRPAVPAGRRDGEMTERQGGADGGSGSGGGGSVLRNTGGGGHCSERRTGVLGGRVVREWMKAMEK